LIVKDAKVLPVNFPLTNIFRTSLGKKSVTRNVIVVLECEDGIRGYGEASASLAMRPRAAPDGSPEYPPLPCKTPSSVIAASSWFRRR
jgi:L-alanine-DL-glutamate epimerase-like enolase superfamily enzyme